MENVQAECKAFDDNTDCKEKNLRIAKLKIKTKKVRQFKTEVPGVAQVTHS